MQREALWGEALWREAIGRAIVLIALVTLVIPMFSPSPVAAQSPSGMQIPAGDAMPSSESKLSVAPAVIENTVDPGVSFTTQVAVSNGTSRPAAFHGTIEHLAGAEPVASVETSDARSWLKLGESDFLLLGGEVKTVDVMVSVPHNAEPGGHYATIYFEAFVPGQANAGASTVVTGRVGVVVALVVRGDIRTRVVPIGEIRTDRWQWEAGPSTLQFDLRNEGNIHVVPNGVVTVRDLFGRKVKELPLVGGRQAGTGPTLMPGKQRGYEVAWEHGPWLGVYRAEAVVLIGPAQDRLVVSSAYFVLSPLVILIPGLLAVVMAGAVVAVRRLRTRRSRKQSSTGRDGDA